MLSLELKLLCQRYLQLRLQFTLLQMVLLFCYHLLFQTTMLSTVALLPYVMLKAVIICEWVLMLSNIKNLWVFTLLMEIKSGPVLFMHHHGLQPCTATEMFNLHANMQWRKLRGMMHYSRTSIIQTLVCQMVFRWLNLFR